MSLRNQLVVFLQSHFEKKRKREQELGHVSHAAAHLFNETKIMRQWQTAVHFYCELALIVLHALAYNMPRALALARACALINPIKRFINVIISRRAGDVVQLCCLYGCPSCRACYFSMQGCNPSAMSWSVWPKLMSMLHPCTSARRAASPQHKLVSASPFRLAWASCHYLLMYPIAPCEKIFKSRQK